MHIVAASSLFVGGLHDTAFNRTTKAVQNGQCANADMIDNHGLEPFWVLPAQQDHKVQQVQQVIQEHLERQEVLAQQVSPVQQDHRVQQVQQAIQEQLERQEVLAHQVSPEQLDHEVQQVQQAPVV